MTKCRIMTQEEKEEEALYGKMLFDWLFHYNVYTGKWNAFKREDANDYFNGTCNKVISNKDYDTCIEKIIIRERKNV